MRLDQLSDKVKKTPKLPDKPDTDKQAALESIMQDMHTTMLKADVLMRKLECILNEI